MLPPLLLTREELEALTDLKQPKRMHAWLQARGWVFEPAGRPGDIPKVSRAYSEARLSGRPLQHQPRRAAPRLDFLAQG
jgi:hypothetical protein